MNTTTLPQGLLIGRQEPERTITVGYLLALVTALLEGTKDLYHSTERMKKFQPLVKALVLACSSFLPLLAILLWKGIPRIDPRFWIVVSVHGVLVAIANVLYMRALALGPLSITQPMLALTPAFMLITTPLMTNDHVTLWGAVGIICVVLGIYGSAHPGPNKDGSMPGFFAPVREMLRQPGVGSKLGVAIIFSMTANLDKLGMQYASGPLYLVVSTSIMITTLSLILGLSRMFPRKRETDLPPLWYLLGGGAINACTLEMHMWALAFISAPNVIAIKRSSIILTSGWEYFVRRTRKPHWYNLIGTCLAVLGAGVIYLQGVRH
ncbi:MAG: DMT family transporter [Patescibacteria group bacterium]